MNRTFGYASAIASGGPTKLGLESLPTLHEIASQPDFKPRLSNAQEFENMWALATKNGGH